MHPVFQCWCFKSAGPLFWIALQVYNSSALDEIYHQKLHRSVFCPGNHKAKAEEVKNTLTGDVSRNENVGDLMHFSRSTYLSRCFPLAEATSALKSIASCYFSRGFAPTRLAYARGCISHEATHVSGKHTMPAYIMHD